MFLRFAENVAFSHAMQCLLNRRSIKPVSFILATLGTLTLTQIGTGTTDGITFHNRQKASFDGGGGGSFSMESVDQPAHSAKVVISFYLSRLSTKFGNGPASFGQKRFIDVSHASANWLERRLRVTLWEIEVGEFLLNFWIKQEKRNCIFSKYLNSDNSNFLMLCVLRGLIQ